MRCKGLVILKLELAMNKKVLLLFLLFFVLFNACKSANTVDEKQPIPNYKTNTIIYRFLYQNDYGFEVNEERFWILGKGEGQDFAVRLTPNVYFPDLMKSISSLREVEYRTGAYYFAFVKSCKDTIYASEDLKDWIVKENGKSKFYKFPDTVTSKTDTVFIKELLKSEPFLRNW